MSTVVTGYKNNVDLLIKGAPDRIIKKCSEYQSFDGTKSFTESDKEVLLYQISMLAGKGLRCLAVAEIPGGGELSDLTE